MHVETDILLLYLMVIWFKTDYRIHRCCILTLCWLLCQRLWNFACMPQVTTFTWNCVFHCGFRSDPWANGSTVPVGHRQTTYRQSSVPRGAKNGQRKGVGTFTKAGDDQAKYSMVCLNAVQHTSVLVCLQFLYSHQRLDTLWYGVTCLSVQTLWAGKCTNLRLLNFAALYILSSLWEGDACHFSRSEVKGQGCSIKDILCHAGIDLIVIKQH
jgi:hypothetical protein